MLKLIKHWIPGDSYEVRCVMWLWCDVFDLSAMSLCSAAKHCGG